MAASLAIGKQTSVRNQVRTSSILATGNEYPARMSLMSLDSFEVRRIYLRTGGSIRATARVMTERGDKTSHQNVAQHVARANRLRPLTHGHAEDLEDRQAIGAYQRLMLRRVGVIVLD